MFTGDEFADGGTVIQTALHRQKCKASFFFTGRFYRNPEFGSLVKKLKTDGHYLGSHSDHHLLYCDWKKRDSLLVSKEQFVTDLSKSYATMDSLGVAKEDALYFLPPFEWYNKTIGEWTGEQGLQLVNFSPGTRSNADYTWPQLGKQYRTSEEIYQSIVNKEATNGLNGFILLLHIGTDIRRTDKFYNQLEKLIIELKGKNYQFVRIDQLLQ